MMDKSVSLQPATYQEIISQTEAWREALAVVTAQAEALRSLWEQGRFDSVVFTGCGSTYYLSLAAAALWQTLMDVPALGTPAGELYLYPRASCGPLKDRRTLLVAVSRSGTTSETMAAAKRFKDSGLGAVIVVTNYGDTPLAALGDVTIAIPSGQEESVVQTRSFASMYVATTALTATLAGDMALLQAMDALPRYGQKLIAGYEPLARRIGSSLDLRRFYFLGSGPRYGLACEASLKLKEMTLTDSEPFHFLEFRHGPMSMVNDKAMVIGLISAQNGRHEMQVLKEMRELGGHILSLGDRDADVEFRSELPEAIRNVLYLPVLQLVAYHRSLAKGLDPDHPNNLSAVIQLDLAV